MYINIYIYIFRVSLSFGAQCTVCVHVGIDCNSLTMFERETERCRSQVKEEGGGGWGGEERGEESVCARESTRERRASDKKEGGRER